MNSIFRPKFYLKFNHKTLNSKYKLDKQHKTLYIEAERPWNTKVDDISGKKGENVSNIAPHEHYETNHAKKTKYWSYKFDEIFHNNKDQDHFFQQFFKDEQYGDNSLPSVDNSLIVCLGAHGSGKSFTITGFHEAHENKGLAPRLLSWLFKIKELFQGTHDVNIYLNGLEYSKSKIRICNQATDGNRVLLLCEQHGLELLFYYETNKEYRRDGQDYFSHIGSTVLHFIVEISSQNDQYKHYSNIFLIELRNNNDFEVFNKKYLRINNFNLYQVHIIGNVGKDGLTNNKLKSLIYSMQHIEVYISKMNYYNRFMDETFKEDNLNVLKMMLKDRILELKGMIELMKAKREAQKHKKIVRDTDEFMARMLLAYIDDKVPEILIIRLVEDVQVLYETCYRLYEPLKMSIDQEKDKLIEKLKIEYYQRQSSNKTTSSMKHVDTSEIYAKNVTTLEKFKNEMASVQIKSFNEVWEEFLIVQKPELKYKLNSENEEMIQLNTRLIEKITSFPNTKDYMREQMRMDINQTNVQLQFRRQQFVQLLQKYLQLFIHYCKENYIITVPTEGIDTVVPDVFRFEQDYPVLSHSICDADILTL